MVESELNPAPMSRDERRAAWAALRMVRDAIGELFGPRASIESEEAVLLRGPEYHHEAEAIIEALGHLARPSPDSPEIEGLVERLLKPIDGSGQPASTPISTAVARNANRERAEAASSISMLEAERDEALKWARCWHDAVEIAETLLGIGPCLAADEFPTAVQARVAAAESTISSLSGDVERLVERVCLTILSMPSRYGALVMRDEAIEAIKAIRAALSTQKGDHPDAPDR